MAGTLGRGVVFFFVMMMAVVMVMTAATARHFLLFNFGFLAAAIHLAGMAAFAFRAADDFLEKCEHVFALSVERHYTPVPAGTEAV